MEDNEPKKIWDPLSEALNIESDINEAGEINLLPSVTQQTAIEDDYEVSRQGITDILIKATESLDEIRNLARASQTARAYEVVANMSKTILDGYKDLLDLSKKKIEVDKLSEVGTGPTTINNHLHVSSTADLQKILIDAGLDTGTRRIIKNDDG